MDMGFPVNACKRATYLSDNNVEAAMNWLCSNLDDPDYNTGNIRHLLAFFCNLTPLKFVLKTTVI